MVSLIKLFLCYAFCNLFELAFAFNYLKKSCINEDCSAVRLTISNPPVNLLGVLLIEEFQSFLNSLNGQNKTKVVVFSSSVPGFYISHLDINIISADAAPGINATLVFEQYFASLDLLLTTPVIFIGEVNGRAWGGGDELLQRMDMRFAGPEALFGAPEAALGVIHVGGLQQLARLIGPGRTAEYMLSSAQVGPDEAARVGWVNAAYPTGAALERYVDQLASRISLFHFETIRATKASIAEQAPPRKAYEDDMKRFNDLEYLPFVQANIARFLSASKNQSREWELNNNDNLAKALYE